MQIDVKTGEPIYPKGSSGQTDGYFGQRIAGGYSKSGEAPYILYDSASGYYYLYVTYGWLAADGGYQIRMYRSKTINGNYVDAAGNSAIFPSGTNQASRGIKVMGNYDFSSYMVGTYEFVNHGTDASTANVGMLKTSTVNLTADGKITGDYTGTWSYTSGSYYCQMIIGGVTYKGVFFKQKDESSSHKEVMTFTLTGNNNETIWGSKSGTTVSNIEGTFYIKNVFSGLYLDVENGSSANNANIRQWSYNGCGAQKFKLVKTSDGYYNIYTGASGYTKVIDVSGKSTADNANIIQYAYNGGNNQKFEIVALANGSYAIKTRITSGASCLDVYGWSTQAGGNIAQYSYWGGDCQLWILEPAS